MAPISRTHGAILYTRVSTGEQDKYGTSPMTQQDACRKKALALSLPIIAEYHDGGVSGGFLMARPGMQAALKDLQEGRADTLICPNISRYSRDVEHQQAVKKAVKAAGGRLVFCDMDFEDTAEGDLNFTIQGGFAEYEKAVIRKRTMAGHQRRAEDGIQTGRATPPFGYIVPKKADILRGTYPADQLGKYLIAEDQAAIVRELFTLYDSAGQSLNDLSKRLNRSGLPTSGGGKMWRASNVRYIFTNPVYKGQGSFGRFDHSTEEGRLMQTHPRTGLPLTSAKCSRPADPETWITWAVPPVVAEDVWERVNVRLTQNKSLRGGNPARVRMLAGRVFCPECGSGMACMSPTKTKSKKPGSTEVFTYPHRYTCLRYRQTLLETGAPQCQPTGYYVHQVEAAVVSALLDACQRPRSVEAALNAYAQAQQQPKPVLERGLDPRQELKATENALARLAERQAATVQAQIAGIMAGADPGAYSDVFSGIAAERKGLEERRGRLSRQIGSIGKIGSVGKIGSARKKGGGEGGRQRGDIDFPALLDRARRVLASEEVPGEVKRDILSTIIEKVVCLKAEDKSAGAEIVFLPGVFADALDGEDTLQSPSEVPEMRRLRAGKCHGSGRVSIPNSDTIAPPPSAISSKSARLLEG